MARKRVYHVIRRERSSEWALHAEGAKRASSLHKTQAEAIKAGRKLARKYGGQLFIHRRNGTIRAKHAYAVVAPMKTTDTKTRQGLRDWWHGILGKYDRYSCYALPLALPSDTEAIGYFGELGKELSLVSGKHCLVIALAGNQSNASCSEEEVWEAAIKEHIYQGYGMEIAEVFGIQPDEFPCVVLFEDIRSPEHVVVALEGMKTKEIATEMRSVFSVVRDAVSHGENALYAIQTHRERERSRRKSQARISQLRSTAEKTLEAVLKALVKRLVEQP